MNTTLPCPEPPDDELEKEKGPTNRANEERGQASDEAHRHDASSSEENQERPVGDLSLVEFADTAPDPLDPGDLTSFAINDDPGQTFAKKALTTMSVRKPPKESFVRTSKDEDAWKTFSMVELKEEGKWYLLSPPIAAALEAAGESTLIRARLVPTVDRHGNLFLWPLKVSDRENDWNLSAYRAARIAQDKWVRVQTNLAAGAYDTLVARIQNAEPTWPDEDFGTILKIVFEDRVITRLDHPVLKELRGE